MRGAALAAIAVLLLAGSASAQELEPKTNLSDIEDEVICLVCGTTLELTDDAPQAQQLRNQIRDLIDRGLTKEEIKDELVAEYGENVLATPDTEGFDLTAWVLPGLAIVLAAVAVAFGLARSRRGEAGTDTTPLSDADAARVEADLRSHDP